MSLRVKPLEWRDSYGVLRAETPFGDYIVTGKILRVGVVYMEFEQVCDDPKAAAQADYESRILSALAPIDAATAARVLLDAGIPDNAVQMAALPLTTDSDLEPSMWNTDDEIREAILAALRALANEAPE